MNKQEELHTKTKSKETGKLNERVKKLSLQYEKGELTSMEALLALKEVLANLN